MAIRPRTEEQTLAGLQRKQDQKLVGILADALALLSVVVNKAVIPFKEEIDATMANIKAEVSSLDVRILEAVTKALLPFREELKATMARIKAEVSSLDEAATTAISNIATLETKVSELVDTLTNKISSSYGHITKTTLSSLDDKTAALAMRLNVLEACIMTQQPTDLLRPSPSITTGAPPPATMPSQSPAVLAADNPVDAQPANVMANSRAAYATLHERNAAGAALRSPAPSTPAQSNQQVTPYPPSRRPPPLCQTTIPETLDHDAGSNETTIPETLGCGAGPRATGEDASMVVGGAIVSPCYSNRAMHTQTLGASRFDIIKLATKEYHVGTDGISTLSKKLIQQCGYGTIKATVEDVVVCFNNIIMVHHRVRELWYNSYAHTIGQQANKILSKSPSVFPKLTTLKVEDVVIFYDRLQEVSMICYRTHAL